MGRKLVYLTSFVLVLGMICNAMGQNGTDLRGGVLSLFRFYASRT